MSRMYRAAVAMLPNRDEEIGLAWESDLGQPLTDTQWRACCEQTRKVSFNYKHKILHFKFLWRA